jgi:hypothetical protein
VLSSKRAHHAARTQQKRVAYRECVRGKHVSVATTVQDRDGIQISVLLIISLHGQGRPATQNCDTLCSPRGKWSNYASASHTADHRHVRQKHELVDGSVCAHLHTHGCKPSGRDPTELDCLRDDASLTTTRRELANSINRKLRAQFPR